MKKVHLLLLDREPSLSPLHVPWAASVPPTPALSCAIIEHSRRAASEKCKSQGASRRPSSAANGKHTAPFRNSTIVAITIRGVVAVTLTTHDAIY